MDDTSPKPEDILIKPESPKREIDEPFTLPNKELSHDKLTTKELTAEKDKERREKRYFSAFKLIILCLVFLFIVYIIDVFISAKLHSESSSITEGIIEIIKTLLFTLSGYLFARKENGE